VQNKFAIIVSRFNETITDSLLEGSKARLIELGVVANCIDTFRVPGAIEIPLVAKQAAKTKKYQAIICLGAVIRGETSHYDYVCEQVSQGCQRVMLDYDIPIIFGVLTTNTIEQAEARVGGTEGHKGKEAADAAIDMVNVMRQFANNF